MRRRKVLETIAGAGLLTAASYRRVLGANDRVRVGFVGIGLIGKRHLLDFMAQPDVEVAAISEVSATRGWPREWRPRGARPSGYKDFRRMLDRKDVDAVVVSTPDHWHALMTILACAAGKDVYVEKPLNHVVREGEWMVRAAQRHNRGWCRSAPSSGRASSTRSARSCCAAGASATCATSGSRPPATSRPASRSPVAPEPLSAADWDMWLGPAPFVPYDREPLPLPLPLVLGLLGRADHEPALPRPRHRAMGHRDGLPARVAAMGGRYSLTGIGETPDLVEALLEYPGFVVNWSSHEASAGLKGGLEFLGTKGGSSVDRAGLEVVPDRVIAPEDQIPSFTSPRRSAGGPPRWRTEPLKLEGYEQVRDQFVPHVRDFLDCVKSRQRAGLGSRERAPDRHLLPSREHRDEGGAGRDLGHGEAGRGGRPRSLAAPHQGVSRALGPRAARCPCPRLTCGSAFASQRRPTPRAAACCARCPPLLSARPCPGTRRLTAGKGRFGIAYTSFAVRMRQGRDLIRGTRPGAPSFPADTFVDLCRSFGADGVPDGRAQLEPRRTPAYLDGVKRRIGDAGLFLELSVDGKTLEDEGRFDEVAALARKLGAVRFRVALLHGRRYEDFPRDGAVAASSPSTGSETLPRAKAWIERHRMPVGHREPQGLPHRRARRTCCDPWTARGRRLRRLRQQPRASSRIHWSWRRSSRPSP